MSFLSSIWNWLGSLLSKIWSWIKKAIPYILLALALYVGFLAPGTFLTFLGLSIPAGWASAAIIAGVCFLIAPEETSALVSSAVQGVGNAAQTVATELGQVAGSGISALSSSSGLSTVLWVAGAGALLWLLMSDDNSSEEQTTLGNSSGGTRVTRS